MKNEVPMMALPHKGQISDGAVLDLADALERLGNLDSAILLRELIKHRISKRIPLPLPVPPAPRLAL